MARLDLLAMDHLATDLLTTTTAQNLDMVISTITAMDQETDHGPMDPDITTDLQTRMINMDLAITDVDLHVASDLARDLAHIGDLVAAENLLETTAMTNAE